MLSIYYLFFIYALFLLYIVYSDLIIKKKITFLLISSIIYTFSYIIPAIIGYHFNINTINITGINKIINDDVQFAATKFLVFQFITYISFYYLPFNYTSVLIKFNINNDNNKSKRSNKLIALLSILSIFSCFYLAFNAFQLDESLYYRMSGLGIYYWMGIYLGIIFLILNYIYNGIDKISIILFFSILYVLLIALWRLTTSIYILLLVILLLSKLKNIKITIYLFISIISIIIIAFILVLINNFIEYENFSLFNFITDYFILFLYQDIGRYPFFAISYNEIIINETTFSDLLMPFSCFGNINKVLCAEWNNLGNLYITGKYNYNSGGLTLSESGNKILLFGVTFSYLLTGLIGLLHKFIDKLIDYTDSNRNACGIAFILAYSSYELSPIKVELIIIFFILYFIINYARKSNNF